MSTVYGNDGRYIVAIKTNRGVSRVAIATVDGKPIAVCEAQSDRAAAWLERIMKLLRRMPQEKR